MMSCRMVITKKMLFSFSACRSSTKRDTPSITMTAAVSSGTVIGAEVILTAFFFLLSKCPSPCAVSRHVC